MQEAFENMLKFDFEHFPGEVISSLIIMLLICIFSFVIYFKFRKADPLEERPSKFICVITGLVGMVQNFVVGIMGK